MRCAKCDARNWRVVLTRHDTCESTMRLRKCQDCGYSTYTVEVELPDDAWAWLSHEPNDKNQDLSRLDGYKRIRFY